MNFLLVCTILSAVFLTARSFTPAQLKTLDEIAVRLGKDPAEVRKMVAEGVINIEKNIQNLLDEIESITHSGTDGLFQAMTNAIDMAKKFVDQARETSTEVINEKEVKVLAMLDEFRKNLPQVAAVGRSGQSSADWEIVRSTFDRQLEMIQLSLEDAKSKEIEVTSLERSLSKCRNGLDNFNAQAQKSQANPTKSKAWENFTKLVESLASSVKEKTESKVRRRREAEKLTNPVEDEELKKKLLTLVRENEEIHNNAREGVKSFGNFAQSMVQFLGSTAKLGLDGAKVVGEHEKNNLQKMFGQQFSSWRGNLGAQKDKFVNELLSVPEEEMKPKKEAVAGAA